MSQPRDVEVLGRVIDYVITTDADEVMKQLPKAHPEAGPALVDYLERRFVRGEPEAHSIEGDGTWWAVLEIVAALWSDPDKAAFVARVGLNAAHPEAYRKLAPFFRVAATAPDMEARVLAGLDAADARTQENASTLAYFLFDGRGEWDLSPEGQRRLPNLHG